MDIQAVLPGDDPAMDIAELSGLAERAERLGYETVWLPDHLLPPEPFGAVYGGVYDPLVTLAYLAARTRTIRLGTSVLVLPMRSPFAVAKQAATLHRISGERLTLGIGAGWDRTEFAAVGADFGTRGARTSEGIALLRALFGGAASFQGTYYAFERGVFEPVPRTPLRIAVGGLSDAALRRAAALGDEWQAVNTTPEEFSRHAARLRDLGDRPVRVTARLAVTETTGIPDAVATARAFAEAGADALGISFPTAGYAARMTEFAEAYGLMP